MEPTLTWIDLTSRDRERMRRVLDLFGEQGTIDEMGLGTLRDGLADGLFPATSSIQTRLRYLLFVPWIYLNLEGRRVSGAQVGRMARDAEVALIRPLLDSVDPEGVIGAQAGASLKRLPSSVYWSALVRLGIFRHRRSMSWYHRDFTQLSRGGVDLGAPDDPGVVAERKRSWHARLPPPPEDFPNRLEFALTAAEADFLRGRIEERTAGSLFAWLAREGSASPATSFWEDPDALRAPPPVRAMVELARRFSLHVEGLPLVYNLLLAERYYRLTGAGSERIDEYQERLARWAAREAAEAPFVPNELWSFLAARGARLIEPQRRFVEAWSAGVAAVGAAGVGADEEIRALVEARELKLKGAKRARLANDGRLLDWSGAVGVGRMDFRWFRVRTLLSDLHRGLALGADAAPAAHARSTG